MCFIVIPCDSCITWLRHAKSCASERSRLPTKASSLSSKLVCRIGVFLLGAFAEPFSSASLVFSVAVVASAVSVFWVFLFSVFSVFSFCSVTAFPPSGSGVCREMLAGFETGKVVRSWGGICVAASIAVAAPAVPAVPAVPTVATVAIVGVGECQFPFSEAWTAS